MKYIIYGYIRTLYMVVYEGRSDKGTKTIAVFNRKVEHCTYATSTYHTAPSDRGNIFQNILIKTYLQEELCTTLNGKHTKEIQTTHFPQPALWTNQRSVQCCGSVGALHFGNRSTLWAGETVAYRQCECTALFPGSSVETKQQLDVAR